MLFYSKSQKAFFHIICITFTIVFILSKKKFFAELSLNMLLFLSIRIKAQTLGKTCAGETGKWENTQTETSSLHPCEWPRNNSFVASTAVFEVSQATTFSCQKKPPYFGIRVLQLVCHSFRAVILIFKAILYFMVLYVTYSQCLVNSHCFPNRNLYSLILSPNLPLPSAVSTVLPLMWMHYIVQLLLYFQDETIK